MQSDNISNSICQNSWYSVFENTFYICNAGQNIFACIKFLNFRWIIASLIWYRATFSKAHDDVLINGPCIRLVLKWYTRRFSYCLDDNIHSFYYSQFYPVFVENIIVFDLHIGVVYYSPQYQPSKLPKCIEIYCMNNCSVKNTRECSMKHERGRRFNLIG